MSEVFSVGGWKLEVVRKTNNQQQATNNKNFENYFNNVILSERSES
jgi:hypothetical protein